MPSAVWSQFGHSLTIVAVSACLAPAADPPRPKPDFNRDIRPRRTDRCCKCHGPAAQKAGVRLDALNLAIKKDAVVPGKPDKSGVIARVTAEDDDDRMPPKETGKRLTPAEIKTLKAWIASGA